MPPSSLILCCNKNAISALWPSCMIVGAFCKYSQFRHNFQPSHQIFIINTTCHDNTINYGIIANTRAKDTESVSFADDYLGVFCQYVCVRMMLVAEGSLPSPCPPTCSMLQPGILWHAAAWHTIACCSLAYCSMLEHTIL